MRVVNEFVSFNFHTMYDAWEKRAGFHNWAMSNICVLVDYRATITETSDNDRARDEAREEEVLQIPH